MGAKTFNNVKINLTLKTTTTRANLSTSSEDLAVQLGKIKKWYDDFAWSAFTAPTVEVTGSGNAITSASWSTSTGKLTLTKGSSFSTVSISRDLTSGTKIGTITIDGTATDIYCQTNTNTDTKVTQAYSTTNNTYPVLLSSVAGISSTASRGDQTSIVNNQIYANPSNGRLYANIPEAFLFWGGKDFSGSYGPIDAAMIPTLSANRAAFYPGDRIVIEYTRDGGTTWLDYGADNTTKTALFTTSASFVVGKSTTSEIATPSCKLRITIKNTSGKLYSTIQKIAIYVSTGGSTGCTVDIKGRTRTNVEAESDTWANLKTAVPISGYSGWNILQTSFTTYGNASSKSSQYDEIRFIFSITSHGSSAAGLSVSKIYMYGGVGWKTPSTLASTGLIYSYDASQNVVFPANITCGGTFIAKADIYTDSLSSGALNMRNSDIYGCNSIKFADLCDSGAEGIQFYRDGTHADSFYGKSGKLYYHPNRAYGSTAGDVYTILHTGNLTITQSLTSGTKIGTITIDGTGTDLYAPSNTDTKVTQTAVGSTYTNYRPLVIGASNSATAGFSPSTVTDTTFTTQAIYCQPASGTIFATKFDGFLAPKLFTSSTVNSTAGSCFFYGNNLLGNGNYDWIGIQGDSGSDKFQLMPYTGNMLLYRQNDNGGSSTDWQDWISLLSPSSVTANGGITATITTTTTGTDDGAATFNSGVRLSHTNSVTAVTSNSLLKFKYDAQGHITGSTAVAASDLPSHTHPYLPLAGGTMDDSAEITIPNGSHSSQYTGFGMYHYIGAGNGWARGINVNSATDGTRIGSLGMYGTANSTEPLYAYFGKAYNDAWYELYKSIFRINDDEENGFQFRYKPSSLSSGYSASFLSLYPGDTYGYGIVLGHSHGGMTIVGSGESASAFTDTAFDSTTTPYGSTVFQFDSESLVLTSDDSIWFVSGASGLSTSTHTDWTNLKTALFDSSGNFRPSVDNKGSIGTSSYKWASIHGTTIYENGTSLASKYAAIGHTHDSLYVPNTNAGVNAAINLLPTGSDDPVDDDYYISQYANGGTTHATYYRRPVSKLYNYIYEKLQHDNAMNISHTFAVWNTVGWHRVLSLPCSSSASGKMIRTLELTAARTYNNAQPEIFSVRLIGLFNATEGFEILYSKSNTAATQLMTKVRMTKSSDGETLYVDIYYNSTTSNSLTVFCALIDPANNNDRFGSSVITWGNGAVVDDSLTVVASLDIPRDITAPGTGFYYVIGTQTSSTAAWTGTIPVSKLHNGLTIAYYLPYASAASTSVTLNLTLSTGATTGAINVYFTGASRMTTHYGAGSTIILTYFEAGAISVGGTATTDARWTHSDYNTNTNTYVTQSSTTTGNYRALMLGYNDSTTPSNLTTTVTNQVYATANLYAQPSTGNLYMAGKCFVGTSSQASYPTGGIHVHDVRNLTVTPDVAVGKSANFYFHQYTCDGTNNYWWGVLNVRGWDDAYSSWELAGPSQNVDQRTTPLYVRTSNTNSAWGNWRKIYDTANPPTYSEVGAAASSHTHSSLNVGNVGGKGIPIYFSSGTPTACSTPASGAWWSTSNALVPQISTAGVLEIGKYIDLHATAASTNNFDYRLEAVGTKEIMLSSADTNNVLTLNTDGYNQIRFKTTATDKSYTALGIVSYPLSANGQTMLFQCGGNMVIGGGEFAAAAYTRKDSTGETQVGYDNIATTEREKLYLGADTEVQIIANAQNLATYSNNDHVVWKFKANGQLITPAAITDTLDLQHTMIHQSVRSESNCVTFGQWIVDGAASTTYRPGISFHNTGGDSTDKGAIILRPYHHNADPWGKNVGLYIGKNILRLDGVNVALQNAASLNTMINALSTGSSAPVDADYYVAQYAGGGTTTTTYHRRPVSALYSYIRSKHIKSAIAVQTGSSKKAKITLQTLMTWLITTKKYIPSGTTEDIIIKTTWVFADNDILRFTANGINYEMSLAGVIIEFKGLATSYNAGEFTFTITSAPTVLSDTPTSGYTRFPTNTTAVYHCNGSGYSPTWTVNMNKAVQQLLYQSTTSVGYGYAEIVIGSVFSNWTMLWLEFMGASYGQSSSNPHSGAGLIPLSLVRSIGVVSAIADQYHIPIGYNPGNTTADQYLAVGYKDDNTLSLSRGGGGGPIGKVKIYGIC